MVNMRLRQALDEFRNVYLPLRNYADRTREEYLNDLEDLLAFLELRGVTNVEGISLIPSTVTWPSWIPEGLPDRPESGKRYPSGCFYPFCIEKDISRMTSAGA